MFGCFTKPTLTTKSFHCPLTYFASRIFVYSTPPQLLLIKSDQSRSPFAPILNINAGGDFRVKASNSINMSSNTCYIKAPYGKIRVREVGWMGGVFAGTKVSESVWGA